MDFPSELFKWMSTAVSTLAAILFGLLLKKVSKIEENTQTSIDQVEKSFSDSMTSSENRIGETLQALAKTQQDQQSLMLTQQKHCADVVGNVTSAITQTQQDFQSRMFAMQQDADRRYVEKVDFERRETAANRQLEKIFNGIDGIKEEIGTLRVTQAAQAAQVVHQNKR